jgi:serine/threonine-protein kinase
MYAEWTILARIGHGSFGNAYRVDAPGFDEPLALKVSHDPITEEQTAQRALREVVVQRECDNDHTPTIYEYGLRPDGHFYLLMELVPGRALSDFHDFTTPMDPAVALSLISQVCSALVPLHERKIVHRDIKPANIFWDATRRHATLLDFGLARSWADGQTHGMTATLNPLLVGTPHYTQPEQLEELPLTPAADVYSLAMIAYELLTARIPFVADRPLVDVRREWEPRPLRWIDAHAEMKVVPVQKHLARGALPRTAAKALNRALAKDPAKRPQHAAQLRSALDEALSEANASSDADGTSS